MQPLHPCQKQKGSSDETVHNQHRLILAAALDLFVHCDAERVIDVKPTVEHAAIKVLKIHNIVSLFLYYLNTTITFNNPVALIDHARLVAKPIKDKNHHSVSGYC